MQSSLAELAGEQRFADWTYYKPYLIFDWFYELATTRALLDAVEALLGPDILLWGGTIALKEPRQKDFSVGIKMRNTGHLSRKAEQWSPGWL